MIQKYVADSGIRLARFGRRRRVEGPDQSGRRAKQADRGRQASKAEEGWKVGWMDGEELCGHDVDGLPHVRRPASSPFLLVS